MNSPARCLFRCLFAGAFLGQAAARADLAGEIDGVLQDKFLAKVSVGVRVLKLGANATETETLYDRRGAQPLTPASNLKLVTTSAALETLGADFHFRTALAVRGRDVALIGDGDPAFGDAELLKKLQWTSTTVYKSWAEVLKKKGISTIDKVIVDDSVFDDQFIHPNWPADQEQKRYVAGVGGMNFNANCLDFFLRPRGMGQVVEYTTDPTTAYADITNTCVKGTKNAVWLSRERGENQIILKGETPAANDAVPISVTIHDPGLYAGTVLTETLRAEGIEVANATVRDRSVRTRLTTRPVAEDGWQVVAVYETPLTQVLARANKDSMNLYAEALCKRLGYADTNQSGTWLNGTAAVGKFLRSIDVPEVQFTLDDGCGLSKKNAIAPAALVSVLSHEFYGKNRDAFLATLSISGQDGTLENRFNGTDLAGRVIGKSGFVEGVSTLSGLLKKKDGTWVAFSVMMNGIPPKSNTLAKALQEKVVHAVDRS